MKHFQQTLAEFDEQGDIYSTLDCLTAIATIAVAYGSARVGARLLGTTVAARTFIGARVTRPTIREEDAAEFAFAALDQVSSDAEFAAGRSLPLADAVTIATAVAAIDVAATATGETQSDPFGLSSRERDVPRLLVEGKCNDHIGTALFISPRTAGTHVANIPGKIRRSLASGRGWTRLEPQTRLSASDA